MRVEPDDVIAFWRDAGPEKWFKRDADLDRSIIERFQSPHADAVSGRLANWEKTPSGALALLILLDQFSRNMFRGTPKAFAQDAMALALAKRSVEAKFDAAVPSELRFFFYLPFMHSEQIADQELCVRLFHSLGTGSAGLRSALEHQEIIRRFGRFPHRNAILGRHTTPTEQAFLDGGGFSG